jgi:hypothetical protein
MTDFTKQPSHRVLAVSPTQQFGADFNRIIEILGTNQPILYPFFEATGVRVMPLIGGTVAVPSETAAAAEALEDDFSPLLHFGGVHSYDFDPTGDHHLAIADAAAWSVGDGTNDSATSWGAWVNPRSFTAERTIMAKYDSAGGVEEWKLSINTSGMLLLELHDASASASEIATATTALSLGTWQFVVVTYDGTETAPVVNLYIDDTLVNDGTTVETGAYVASENTAAPVTIGCAGVTATPTLEFDGRVALPFMTGKTLSATAGTASANTTSMSEIQELRRHTRKLMGV